MSAQVIRGDAAHLPLADTSVDLIVTSPPYWSLRSYTDGGHHYDGQIGAEPTPAEYVSSLIDCTREWMRVLKPSGSLWVNLGDKYATRWSSRSEGGGLHNDRGRDDRGGRNSTGCPEKSLIGLPWRYAIRCVDDLGLILRAEVIWSKPNGLPESVTDRVRRSHETWFHFTKSPRYFAAVDAIREASGEPKSRGRNPNGPGPDRPDRGLPTMSPNTLGKLPGSVWEVATQPLKVPAELGVDHFAAFPMEWPRRIVQGWSPSGICTACGEGRRLVIDRDRQPTQRVHNGRGFSSPDHGVDTIKGPSRNPLPHRTTVIVTGEACACPDASAPTWPAVVLDPFGGTGTTALVAAAYGRHGISVDMSADYCRLATWRTSDPGQRAAAAQQPKPKVISTQAGPTLFDSLEGDA